MNKQGEIPSVGLHGVTIGYRQNALFGAFDLDIAPATFNILVGANGSGKSTLLKTIGGVIPALTGSVTIAGEPVDRLSPRRLSRLVSHVRTARNDAAAALTVREIVEMGRYPYTGFTGRLGSADHSIVDDAMSAVGIAHKCACRVGDISDGEHQKALIARAIAQRTPLVMLDEPTNFLDAASRIELLTLLADLVRGTGMTVLMSTHDTAAFAVADNIVTVNPAGSVPVSLDAVGSDAANLRLSEIFAERGITFDPATSTWHQLPLKKSPKSVLTERF